MSLAEQRPATQWTRVELKYMSIRRRRAGGKTAERDEDDRSANRAGGEAGKAEGNNGEKI